MRCSRHHNSAVTRAKRRLIRTTVPRVNCGVPVPPARSGYRQRRAVLPAGRQALRRAPAWVLALLLLPMQGLAAEPGPRVEYGNGDSYDDGANPAAYGDPRRNASPNNGAANAAEWSAGDADSGEQQELTLRMAPRETKHLAFDEDIDFVIIGNPDVADVFVLDIRNITLLATGVGTTELTVGASNGSILMKRSVRVDAPPREILEVIEQVIGFDADIRVVSRRNALFVSGKVKDPAQASRLLRAIRAVTNEGTQIIDDLAFERAPQVNLEVTISEVSRSVTNNLGIDWNLMRNHATTPIQVAFANGAALLGDGFSLVDASGFADGAVVLNATRTFGLGSGTLEVDAFLEALAENGLGVVHAKPNLTTISGQTATFFAGLEIPVPTISGQGNIGTEFRETGVSLSFTPVVLDRETISLQVQPEIREVVAGGTVIAGAAIPNINERSASTTVELGSGESMAIAGLYRRADNTTESGIPMLKDIPLWGSLFRDVTVERDTVELIIVVTPRIVSALPANAAATIPAPGTDARSTDDAYYY